MNKQITEFEKVIQGYARTTIGLSVCFVLDGSDNMTAYWNYLILVVREIMDRLVIGRSATNFSAIQFGSSVKVAQEMTSNIHELNMAIQKMGQVKGKPKDNLKHALLATQSLFKLQNHSYKRLVVALVSGGCSASPETTNILRQENINIMSLGFGDVELIQMCQIASNMHYAFTVPTLHQRHLMFTLEATAPGLNEPYLEKSRVREQRASFTLEFRNLSVASVQLLVFRNNEWETIDNKKMPVLTELGTTLEAKELEPDTQYHFQALITLDTGQQAKSNMVNVKTRKFNAISNLLNDKTRLKEENKLLINKIRDFSAILKHEVRIGMVGKIGNGKSAATNSFTSIFKNEYQYFLGVDRTLQPKAHLLEGTKFEILDFFGWDDHDQYESDLKYLIHGLAPDTLREGESLKAHFKTIDAAAQRRKRFYGVFILVSPADVAQSQHMAYNQGLYDYITRQGLQPIVLLTKVDLIDADLVDKPENVYSSDLVDMHIQQLTKKFPRGLVFPIMSYVEPRDGSHLDPAKDHLLLRALKALIFSIVKAHPGLPKLTAEEQRLAVQESAKLNASQLTVMVRKAGTEEYVRCKLQSRTIECLVAAIRERFKLDVKPRSIIEIKNGKAILLLEDQDVTDVEPEATIEYKI